MTILGKILVIVNLVFSVVVAALLIIVYATSTNWKLEYEKKANEVVVADHDVQQFYKDVPGLEADPGRPVMQPPLARTTSARAGSGHRKAYRVLSVHFLVGRFHPNMVKSLPSRAAAPCRTAFANAIFNIYRFKNGNWYSEMV